MGFGLMALALAAAQATTAQPTDGMPPVMIDMVPPARIEGGPLRQPEGDGYLCSAGYADCLRVVRGEANGGAQLEVFDMDAAAADIPTIALPAAVAVEDGMDIAVWDRAIRLLNRPASGDEGRRYIVGVIRRTPVAYSGGFASAERLHLFVLTIVEGGAALGPELVSLPWTAEAQIRACFGEDDQRSRRGECHDIYRYTPALAVGAERDSAYPSLTYTAVATAFPRTARRSEDSSEAPPLTPADLVEWRDPECSYSRTLRWNPATERYEMDRIAPDCADYTSP